MGHLILIGYMGTGKSRVGQALARMLERPFIDLDERIETRKGKSIPRIFEEDGEKNFREFEKQELELVLEERTAVIATGGGTPCSWERLRLMKEKGTLFLLEADPRTLSERLRNERAWRPALKRSDEEGIRQHLEERALYYKEAHHRIPIGSDTPDEIAKRILQLYRR